MTLPPRVSDLIPFDLLLSVARLGSLGRAAAEHGMSQPAASARMRQLEQGRLAGVIGRYPSVTRSTPGAWQTAATGLPEFPEGLDESDGDGSSARSHIGPWPPE